MLPISKIDSEFRIFKDNKVVIWGAGYCGKEMLSQLESVGVEVFAFCDNQESKWGSTYETLPVISP